MPRSRVTQRPTIRVVPNPKDYIALAQNARRVAQELEELSASFDRAGGAAMVTRFAAAHQMEIPRLDLPGSVRALRSNAGMLFLIANSLAHRTLPKQESVDDRDTTPCGQPH